MTKQLLILFVFASLAFLTCNYCSQPSMQSLKTKGDQPIRTVQSVLSEGLNRDWYVTTEKFKESLELTAVEFVDTKHGWIGGQGEIFYSTADGGRTWKTSRLGTGPNSYVSSISFLAGGIGWAAVRRDPPKVMERRGYISIVLRTNDAGQSWQEQRAWEATQIYKVRFVNQNDGWAVGRKLEDGELFLSRTTDGGSTWLNQPSASLNFPGNDFGTDIYTSEPDRATLLTVDGRIYTTLDGGQNWKQAIAVRDEPGQTSMAKVGILQNENLWVLGSTDSKEGMWTTILKQQNDHGLTRFRLDGVYLIDIVFLSEDWMLGAGSMPSSKDALFGSRAGVVLDSSDGGRTWAKIYFDLDSPHVNAIATQAGEVWMVGDRGLMVHLSKSKSLGLVNN